MNRRYAFSAYGVDGNEQVWRVTGSVECEFNEVFAIAVAAAKHELSIRGDGINCVPPYQFRRIVIMESRLQGDAVQ